MIHTVNVYMDIYGRLTLTLGFLMTQWNAKLTMEIMIAIEFQMEPRDKFKLFKNNIGTIWVNTKKKKNDHFMLLCKNE